MQYTVKREEERDVIRPIVFNGILFVDVNPDSSIMYLSCCPFRCSLKPAEAGCPPMIADCSDADLEKMSKLHEIPLDDLREIRRLEKDYRKSIATQS